MEAATDTKPFEAEPKQKPVKRPAKPRNDTHTVTRGIAYLDATGDQIRVRAGGRIDATKLPAKLVTEYAERGDIIKIDNPTGKAE